MALVGLNQATADDCSAHAKGCYQVALATFVQSSSKVPDTAFANVGARKTNAGKVNVELKSIYDDVAAVMAARKCTENAAWDALRANWNVAAASSAAAASSPAKAGLFPAPAAASASPPTADANAKPAGKPKKYTKERFDGAFFDLPRFWTEEVDARATLVVKDHGFLLRNKAVLRERMLKWVDACKFYDGPLEVLDMGDADEETARVIIKDSVRTWFDEEHREKFSTFLFSIFHEFGNYGQSMSYLAGICLTALTERETAAILRKCNKDYIPRHWQAEATGFATNAWLIESIMQKTHPDVARHFDSINFWPDMYMQKIISGCCVHVLLFETLFGFLDSFLTEGFTFLIKFVLAIVEQYRAQLLAIPAEGINELFEIMRLDSSATDPEDHEQILARARKMDIKEHLEDLDIKRMTVYDKKVAPRLAKAPKEPAFEPCEKCEKNRPKWWCDDCEATLCDACHEGNVGGHTADHTIDKY
jgi:hypothetical protein